MRRKAGMEKNPDKIGKYKLIREVGRGATATVYLAEHPQYPEPVALKLIRFDDKAKDEAKWNRRLLTLLRAEMDVSRKLDHPNIIKIFDTCVEKDYAYIVMEYFPGTTLEHYCSFQNLLPLHRTIGMVFKCAMALGYMYRQGLVHRDVKPANILVSVDGDDITDLKISDFGSVLDLGSDQTQVHRVGSLAYISPEQLDGATVDCRADIYSLAAVLYHLIAGRPPFEIGRAHV